MPLTVMFVITLVSGTSPEPPLTFNDALSRQAMRRDFLAALRLRDLERLRRDRQ
jgi:hypothetical protein